MLTNLVITFFIVLVILLLCMAGLGIAMLIKKGGKFPETHIGRNKNMKDLGITCAQTTDRQERARYKPIEIKKKL
ncbi:MAG: hypothetical protein ACRDDZ_10230 [Marinifilaceae bacterium]